MLIRMASSIHADDTISQLSENSTVMIIFLLVVFVN